MPFLQHATCGLLSDQEAAECAHGERAFDLGRDEIDDGSTRPSAGIVDNDVRRAEAGLERFEKASDLVRVGRIACESMSFDRVTEGCQFVRSTRSEGDPDSFACE